MWCNLSHNKFKGLGITFSNLDQLSNVTKLVPGFQNFINNVQNLKKKRSAGTTHIKDNMDLNVIIHCDFCV